MGLVKLYYWSGNVELVDSLDIAINVSKNNKELWKISWNTDKKEHTFTLEFIENTVKFVYMPEDIITRLIILGNIRGEACKMFGLFDELSLKQIYLDTKGEFLKQLKLSALQELGLVY